jgi:hypothetical protein
MKRVYIYLTIMACALALITNCNRVDESESNFDNVIYVENAKVSHTERIAVKKEPTAQRLVSATIALPEAVDIAVTFKPDLSLVETFGKTNYMTVQPLPAQYFNLPETHAVIKAGNVRSTDVPVNFQDLQALEKNVNYVLPVTIENADINTLKSAKTIYFLLRRGAIITVAANTAGNYFEIPSLEKNKEMDGLTAFTFEGLVRPKELVKAVNTFMGIEGYCLIRFGDVGQPANRAQFCGAWTDMYLTVGKWQHVAFTFDVAASAGSDGRLKAYLDGELVWEGTSSSYDGGTLDLGWAPYYGWAGISNRFYIGYSYDAARDFVGDMCELRIWKTVRTQEEIASNMYEVAPDSEGLMAYWKMDEGAGTTIKDYSGHKLDGKTKENAPVVWISVELPAEN